MKKLLAAFILFGASLASPAISQVMPPSNAATHQQLRDLKDRMVAAVNKKDEAALLAGLNPNIWFTAMNNETFHGLDGAKHYYEKMMVGSSSIVENMSLNAIPDDLSVLYADDRTAVSTGSSIAHFRIRGGSEFDVPLRWTATLVNDGGKWTIASTHFSANMFDNPVMNAVERFSYWLAAGLLLAGLAIGWFVGRARRKTA